MKRRLSLDRRTRDDRAPHPPAALPVAGHLLRAALAVAAAGATVAEACTAASGSGTAPIVTTKDDES